MGDWPCAGGALLVPAGTTIEWDPDPERARVASIGTYPHWRGVRLPLPMPLNAKCMDQAAYDAMLGWHEPHNDQIARLLHYTPNVKPKGAK